jgi:TRAP-type C4-dicarboxylate transport system permease small subunit
MVCAVSLQILTRYVFFYSLSWTEELSRYMFAWLIFLGASIGVGEVIEIRIDFVESVLKSNGRRVLNIFQDLVSLGVSIVFIVSSLQIIKLGAYQLSPALQIKMSYVYICIPIGMVLVGYELISRIIGRIKNNDSTIKEGE